MKSLIIEELGQSDILLPSLIAEGLQANDRVKARLSILQTAGRHARDPHGTRFDMANECRAAGIDAFAMETLVNGASHLADERIMAPGLGKLTVAIFNDVAAMAQAVKAGNADEGGAAIERLAAIKAAAPAPLDDTVEQSQVARLTGLSGGNDDSLHRLVMDLHKSLNRLSADHAEEILAGAHVYGLLAEDRPRGRGFHARRRIDPKAEI